VDPRRYSPAAVSPASPASVAPPDSATSCDELPAEPADGAAGPPCGGPQTFVVSRALLGVFVVLLCVVWVDVHSWESYLYAASAEGFVQLAQLFAEPGGRALPDISRFHPYHPLFHAVGAALFTVFGKPFGISALTLTVAINKVAAVVVLVVGFRLLRRTGLSASASLVALGFVASTKAFLFGAFSAEAHMVSLAFLLAVVERTWSARAGPPVVRWVAALGQALVPSVLFVLGAAFNVAVVFYGILPFALLLTRRRFAEAAAALVLSGAFLGLIFVVVPVVLFDLSSMEDYRRLVALYADLPRATPPLGQRVADAVAAIGVGVVAGLDNPWVGAARLVVAAIAACGAGLCVVFRRWRRWFFAVFWTVGFVVGEVVLNVATSVNGTVYVVFAVGTLVAVLFAQLPGFFRPLMCLGLVVLGLHNGARVVGQKAWTKGVYESPLTSSSFQSLRGVRFAVYVDHLSVFSDVYALGHDLGISDITMFVAMLHKSSDSFADFLERYSREPLCVLSSRPLPLPMTTLIQKHIEMTPDVYHFSVNHPESQRTVHKVTWLACRGVGHGVSPGNRTP
jgi:hypothetical protein